jgi:Domain of unknown function (DUF4365)
MTDQPAGKKGRANRTIERAGVRAAQKVFENAGFLFQEIDLANDIGKDAYVDLAQGGIFGGDMVALQVKSGEKYRRGDDFKVPCDANDVAIWRGSLVPIVGVVFDMSAETLHWADLTAWAQDQSTTRPGTFCPVERANVLSAETLDAFVAVMRRRLRDLTNPAVFDLAADDALAQRRAVYDCWAVGRRDVRALVVLRASLRWLDDVDALWPAIQILSLATPHPDVFWTDENRLPEPTTTRLQATYRWSVEEAGLLLGAPVDDMWQRGGLGQSVYMLLVEDPNVETLLRQVIERTTDDEIAYWATGILVHLAGDHGLTVLDEVVLTSPLLQADQMVTELRQTLVDCGHISIF